MQYKHQIEHFVFVKEKYKKLKQQGDILKQSLELGVHAKQILSIYNQWKVVVQLDEYIPDQ